MLMRSGRELWWFLLLERSKGQYGGRDEMYTYLLYSAGRFRRMKEQGEVFFFFYFSFVHYLEISPDLETHCD